MQLCKFFNVMGIVTALALTYIHMQMQIIDLAYAGNRSERQIAKFIEENGNAKYKILMLKSANHLGGTMLDENSPMQFADSADVMQIAASGNLPIGSSAGEQSKLAKRASPLLSLLSFGVEAEAKTSE